MRLLIVEDNIELARLVAAGLLTAGYETDVVGTVGEARDAVRSVKYAAMILDLGLPDGDGLSLLVELRRRMDPLPVLVLTARDGLQDRVTGLRNGADDYLAKPFAVVELVARLEAILRRPGQLLGSSLNLANLVYDTESRQIFIDGIPRVFSARETSVLEILLRRQGRVVPKKNVEDHIFGLTGEVASNAVEVYVSRLRKQLGEYGAKILIHTIRGVGYLMAEEK
jgi:DNA-binding response OmpR family regulator